jgi:hypothetical protein
MFLCVGIATIKIGFKEIPSDKSANIQGLYGGEELVAYATVPPSEFR